MTNDNDLSDLLKCNPSIGFQELLSRHGSKLYRAAFRLMREKAEIEDVLQDSLVAVFKNIHRINGKGELLAWLYRIVVNTALLRQEASRVIDEGIRRLPLHYRAVYVLSDIEDLATREIAAILDLTPVNVKSRLHRARLCLRRMLASYRPTVSDGRSLRHEDIPAEIPTRLESFIRERLRA